MKQFFSIYVIGDLILSAVMALGYGQVSAPQSSPLCVRCGRPVTEHTATPPAVVQPAKAHPPFQNRFQYRRAINPQLQARAQKEALILARGTFESNQRAWRANAANGHPIGVPPGYIGGTGCSWPGGNGTIATCEPDTNLVLVAEAVAQGRDGTWYASRIWKQ